MKATVKMIAKLQEMGIANLWQKNGYSRLYIDLEKANDLYRNNDDMDHAQLIMNRRDRDNGKLWIDMDSCEICTKSIGSGDEVIEQIIEMVNYYIAIDEAAEAAESTEAAEEETEMMNENEIYDLCKENAITLTEDGNLAVARHVSDETIAKIKQHKNEIVDALSGYCFSLDVYNGSGLNHWQIIKRSTIGDVWYPPVTVFEGTASEVDTWAKAHRDDPFFGGNCTSMYTFCRMSK